MNQNNKNQLRKELRAARNSLTHSEQRDASDALAKQILRSRAYRTSKRIALYFATDGEISTDGLMTHIWQSGRQCYLPVLSNLAGGRLWFAPVDADSTYLINRFGIPEPAVHSRRLLNAMQLDLILMPLVGFDDQGNRIGMGGGFYDRTLAFRRRRQKWLGPRLIGLGHACQQVNRLDVKAWDIALDAIATDKQFKLFKK